MQKTVSNRKRQVGGLRVNLIQNISTAPVVNQREMAMTSGEKYLIAVTDIARIVVQGWRMEYESSSSLD
jgi:hypothetical protein